MNLMLPPGVVANRGAEKDEDNFNESKALLMSAVIMIPYFNRRSPHCKLFRGDRCYEGTIVLYLVRVACGVARLSLKCKSESLKFDIALIST